MTNGSPPNGFATRLMALTWRRPPTTLAEQTRRRVVIYLIPFLFCLYILAYLDRVNVSVAQLGMERPPEQGGLGFTRDISGFGAGIFFWGYWILEIPSTVTVVRWGARWVFVRILVLWGLCAAMVGAIGTPFGDSLLGWLHLSPEGQFYLLRFMLGFFEGGFFPSVIVYLALWFRPEDRAKAIASFMSAIPLSSMLGLPLSGLLLDVHWFGLDGWRWIFIVEGILPVLAGFVTLFFLPDRPARAAWLPPAERDWLLGELDREHRAKLGHGPGAWKHHLGIVLLLTIVYFGLNVTNYGLGMFMPRIIQSQLGLAANARFSLLGLTVTTDQFASFVASLPYVMGFIAMLLNGRHSDRSGERIWHVAVPLALSGLGILAAALTDGVPLVPVLIMIFWVGAAMYAHLPAFWPIPTMFLGATTAAAAIGFINMLGNLGGSVGPMMVGKTPEGQTSFAPALLRLAPWPLLSAGIILIIGYTRSRFSRRGTMTGIPDRKTFETAYAGQAPWDIGKPQKAFVDVADQVTGSILDAGCGTGDAALFFAGRGHRVTGIDYLEEPIARARRKAAERGQPVNFFVMDATALKDLPEVFDAVIDSGLFHVFSDADRQRYVEGLGRVVKPGGRVFLLCFSEEEPGTQGPRRVSKEELHAAFADGWAIESITPSHFEVRPDLKDLTFSPGGSKAWFAVVRRK
jgi:ACS family tartrate transporter-like MFS transporter